MDVSGAMATRALNGQPHTPISLRPRPVADVLPEWRSQAWRYYAHRTPPKPAALSGHASFVRKALEHHRAIFGASLLVATFSVDDESERTTSTLLQRMICGREPAACPIVNLAGPLGSPPLMPRSAGNYSYFQSKIEAMRALLEEANRSHPSLQVAYVDHDVLWGGRERSARPFLSQLRERLGAARRSIGARPDAILMGAELVGWRCYPLCGHEPPIGPAAKASCPARASMDATRWTWRDREPKHLNTGMYHGRVAPLLELTRWWWAHLVELGKGWDDQGVLNYWWLASPPRSPRASILALDYCSRAFHNMAGYRPSAYRLVDSRPEA